MPRNVPGVRSDVSEITIAPGGRAVSPLPAQSFLWIL